MVVANFLVSDPLFLNRQVTVSNNIPLNSHQTNAILRSDKYGLGPSAQLSLSEVQAWLRGGGPCRHWLPCPRVFAQHPVWVFLPVPRPG